MKRVEVVRGEGLKRVPFRLNRYVKEEEISTQRKINKKVLRSIADELGLAYDESHIIFAKKVLNAYLKKSR